MRKLLLLLMAVALSYGQLHAQSRTVTGKVTDETGSPIPNASVLVKGKSLGTTTNSEGAFSLTLPPDARILVVTSVGMEIAEVTIGDRGVFEISMQAANRNLQEVVVVGYGTQRRGEVTGNIASVKGASVANKPVQSFEQALGGRAAGVQVTIPSGVLNTPPVLRIYMEIGRASCRERV